MGVRDPRGGGVYFRESTTRERRIELSLPNCASKDAVRAWRSVRGGGLARGACGWGGGGRIGGGGRKAGFDGGGLFVWGGFWVMAGGGGREGERGRGERGVVGRGGRGSGGREGGREGGSCVVGSGGGRG